MDIALIRLPDLGALDDEMYIPLGLLYVAATLKEAGHRVRIMDLAGRQPEEWLGYVPLADAYGISATTADWPGAIHLAPHLPGHTVIGGSHATAMPELAYAHFRSVVLGPGEIVADAAFHAPGIYQGVQPKDLDAVPFPAWDLWPGEIGGKGHMGVYDDGPGLCVTLVTARGCPSKCSFCCRAVHGQRLKFRSPENVAAEIVELKRRGYTHFRLEDDTATITKGRITALCEAIAPLGVFWRGHTRTDRIDLETLKMMYAAGCREVSFGIESGSQRVLDINRKGTTVEQNVAAIRWAKEAGLVTKGYLIIGLPGESPATVDETKAFLAAAQPDQFTLMTFVPLPGSDAWLNPGNFGITKIGKRFEEYHIIGQHERDGGFVAEIDSADRDTLMELRGDLFEYLKSGAYKES